MKNIILIVKYNLLLIVKHNYNEKTKKLYFGILK